MADTIHLRGEGGSVFAFDLPLPEAIADRVAKGQLHRVAEDGGPWVEPDPELPLDDVEEGGEPPADDRVDPDEYTAEELRQQAADLGLPTSGTKAELAERISAKLAD